MRSIFTAVFVFLGALVGVSAASADVPHFALGLSIVKEAHEDKWHPEVGGFGAQAVSPHLGLVGSATWQVDVLATDKFDLKPRLVFGLRYRFGQ